MYDELDPAHISDYLAEDVVEASDEADSDVNRRLHEAFVNVSNQLTSLLMVAMALGQEYTVLHLQEASTQIAYAVLANGEGR